MNDDLQQESAKNTGNVSQLAQRQKVSVLSQDENSDACKETTARKLVAMGLGNLLFEREKNCGELDVTVFAPPEIFSQIMATSRSSCEILLPLEETKRGRPKLAEVKRASQVIQLRVTAKRKQQYERMARASFMNLSAWMISVCDKASGYEA